MQVAYDSVMLVCNQLGFKRKDRLVREVRAAPEEAEEVMIIEDEEQMSNGNRCGESGGSGGPQSLGIQNDVSVDISVSLSPVKQKPRESAQLDYSQVGEEEVVITLGDSEEEDNYKLNYSQVVDDDLEDILVDSPIPSPDLDASSRSEQSDEDSDVEILEILNSSQTPLFAKIYKSVHKVDPDVAIKAQVEELEELAQESQSLLGGDDDYLEDMETNAEKEEPEAGFISRALQEIPGCDENMVRGAIRRVKARDGQLDLEDENQVVALVREEVDEIMVAKVSKEVEGVTEFEVKICLGELKEMDEGEVTEAMLLQRVMQQKEEGELLKKLAEDNPIFNEEKVRIAMKAVGVDHLTVESLPAIEKELKQPNVTEDEMITEAIEAEKAEVEEKAVNLSKIFDVSFEVAKEKLEESGFNIDIASQALLDLEDNDDEAILEGGPAGDIGPSDDQDLGDLVRSTSPELLEMEEDDDVTPAAKDKHVEDDQSIKDAHQRDTSLDNVDDLLEGLSDEEIEKPPSIKTTVKPSLPSSTTPTSSPSTHLMSLITTTAPSFTSSTSSTGLSSRAPTQADNVVDSEEEAKTMDEWVTEFDSSDSVDTNSEDDEDEEMNLSGLSEEQVKKKEDECRSSRDSRRRKVKAYYDKFFSEEHEDINNNNLF